MSREDDVKRAREWMALHPYDSEGPTYDEGDLADLIADVRRETQDKIAETVRVGALLHDQQCARCLNALAALIDSMAGAS